MFSITRVVLNNFRSFIGEHTFELPTEPGLYLLTGRNKDNPRLGANDCGKSTLMEAIHWCLYGRTSRGLKAGDVVAWGHKSCSVETEVTVGAETCVVFRQQNPNKLLLDDKEVSQEALEKLLRLGPTAFTYAVMIPQFGEAFFDLKPADKLTLFSDIKELDFWLKKSDAADILAKQHKHVQNGFKFSLTKNLAKSETLRGDVKSFASKRDGFIKDQTKVIDAIKLEREMNARMAKYTARELADTRRVLAAAEVRLAEATQKPTEKCPTCGQSIRNEKAELDIKSLMRNVDDFKRAAAVIERKQAGILEKADNFNKSIQNEKERKNPFSDMLKDKKQKLTDLNADSEKLRRSIADEGENYEAANFWVSGFKRIRLFIIEETLRQLELEVNNSLAQLGLVDWAVEFDIERENKSGGITKGFTVLIHAPGAPGPVRWEAWGGGATQRLRLAGDLGLANLIMEQAGLTSTIEFFDEPSKHLSQEGLLDMAETLHNRAVSTNKRILLVDHHAIEFGDFAGTITVVKDSKGSRIRPLKP